MPARTDDGRTEDDPPPIIKATAKRRSLNVAQAKEELLQRDGAICKGCKIDFHFDTEHLQVDHNLPRADGGKDELDNLTLLCGPCNRIKGHCLTLSGLIRENKKRKRYNRGDLFGQVKLQR